MKPALSTSELSERKARLLRESAACREGLLRSQATVMQKLDGASLLHGALRRFAGIYGSPLAAPGMRALRAFAPAAFSWVIGKQLRRPALVAASLASLMFIWARSSSRKKKEAQDDDRTPI